MQFADFLRHYSEVLSQVATMMVISGIFFIFLFTMVFFSMRLWLRKRSKVFKNASGHRKASIAFFHPYCNAGGGGERVLWVAVRLIQRRYPNIQCVIYTGDTDSTPDDILATAAQRFNIVLLAPVEFVYLHQRGWVEATRYPYFTMLGQSMGSLVLGLEALYSFVPDLYFDSMGYTFTLPLFKYLGGCLVGCYVHYPTISTDMLSRVSERVAAHNNRSFISSSPLLSYTKLMYYRLFAYFYGIAGKRSNVIMVNSTWTYNHIAQLWGVPQFTNIVYPPCDVTEFLKIPLESDETKPKQILSLGQFRPEKDHSLQIKSFHKFIMSLDENSRSQYRLVLAGGCRNQQDVDRVDFLKNIVNELGIEDVTEFRINIPFSELKQLLKDSVISLHTMWNEHFGISVVEGMAAGTVMLAHDSGGPKLDIVLPHNDSATGFLASDVYSYTAAMKHIFEMSPAERLALCRNARESLSRFSEEEFDAAFSSLCEPLLRQLTE